MRRALALVFATLSLGACSLAVTTALDEVGCEQEGRVGPPACRKGQICRSGTCRSCASAEVCGNGVDDDCNGSVDDGCPGGAGGAGGVAGASGAAGVAAASAGAAGSKAGAAGAASTGGTGGGSAGTGGAGGAGAGAGGVSAGGAGAGSGGGGAGGASGGAAGAAPTYGAACTSPSECPFGALCETLAKLGESMSGKVCTKPCCNSSECGQVGDGAACIPVQAGTGMCLKAAPFGRPKLGMGVTGDACGTDGGLCRSGFCDGGKCNDVCCKDAACSGSDECVRRQITVGTPRWAYACGKAVGGLDANKVCSDDGECRTNACLVREDTITNLTFCSSPCCNSQACGAVVVLGQQFPVSCRYVQQGSASQWLRTCTSVASGGAATGASCTGNADCRSDFCIPGTSGSYCSDACCSDGDCPPSLKCRPFVPSNSTVGVLRCIQ